MNKKIPSIPAIGIIALVAIIAGTIVILTFLQMKDIGDVGSFEKKEEEKDDGESKIKATGEVSLREIVNEDNKTYKEENYNFEIACSDKSICFLDKSGQKILISTEIDSLEKYYIEELLIEFRIGSNDNCEQNTVSIATGAEGKKVVSDSLTERGWPETLNIDNSVFYRYFSVESSMGGKSITEHGYKTLRNDICYEIILVSKGANNLENEKVIKEDIFFPIFSTFRFID